MSATPKLDKHVQGHCESPTPSSIAGGHKASFRATKLARRARSFKEDFLEKISQMRSPGGCGTPVMRSHSPTITNREATSTKIIAEPNVHKNLTFELNLQLRQVEVALKHFRDVVAKNKLEMLPGNGTIVLDTITTIHTALQSSVLGMSPGNQSSSLSSANHQVYQSLARLIKLCDDVLLYGNKALEKENASEVVGFVEDAVQNLVRLAKDKLSNRDSISNKTLDIPQRTSYGFLDISGQRNSLPDIPLTPRERQILEQTSGPVSLVRSSHSSESILRDSTQPPPKPPLPEKVTLPDKNKSGTPPPIPPKKRQPRTQQLIDESGSSDNSLLGYSLDRSSLRSRSPEDSSSLLSASAGSLDSVLNQSRDEDEIRALMDNSIEETILHNDMSELMLQANGSYSYNWDDRNNQDQPLCSELTRFSNPESGIGNSVRSSVLSAVASCKNSSQSAQWSSCNRQLNNLFIKTENSSCMQKSESIIQNLSKQMESSQYFESTQKVMKSETSVQNITVLTSTSTLSNLNQLLEKDSIGRVLFCDDDDNEVPPELPQKTRTMKRERRSSEYDNVCPEGNGEHLSTCNLHSSHSISVNTTTSATDSAASQNDSPENKPPPLPLKKKHIMAYMEMFGNIGAHTAAGSTDMLRHSVHTYNIMHNDWQNHGGSNHTVSMSTAQSCSFNILHSSSYVPHTTNLTLPSVLSPTGADTNLIINLPTPPRSPISLNTNDSKPPALPPKKSKLKPVSPRLPSPPTYAETPVEYQPNKTTTTQTNHISVQEPSKSTKTTSDISVLEKSSQNTPETVVDSDAEVETNILEELEVTKYLVLKKDEDDGHEIRGGHPDALIIHATKPGKNYLSYQEAFLTTYRTFLQPLDVVEKLQHRHQRFSTHSDPQKQRAAREAFSLLVRVVSELTLSDLDKQLFIILMEFVYQLLCNGDLAMAKALRVKLTDKYVTKQSLTLHQPYLTSITTYTRTSTLLDFKSEQVAEQMTLLDANLFMKIEIPEVLVWAREQNEERSPNLTCFTEHFNKMSYWARTRILEQEEAKDREKYVLKFIKIMKHLRKINNFNSYLALLSAIDSAPIRRLEWQKHITEGLKEYCALIDSSSSFRAYRQALSDTHPPCIPYIGLVLQDLTFVHIGNSDLLPDGSVNFSKRWQQFSIVENMKKFKKETYSFKKHERIIAFFNNFDDYISEEAMWQISEKIKPRGGKKAT